MNNRVLKIEAIDNKPTEEKKKAGTLAILNAVDTVKGIISSLTQNSDVAKKI